MPHFKVPATIYLNAAHEQEASDKIVELCQGITGFVIMSIGVPREVRRDGIATLMYLKNIIETTEVADG